MTYRVEGVIIGKVDVRDADRLYILYTKEQGKIAVIAQGVKKISSKLAGSLELASTGTFTIAKGKAFDRIATFDVSEYHSALLGSLDHTAAALYCFEIIDQLVKESDPDPEIFFLIIDFLKALNSIETERKPVDIAHECIAHLLVLLGYHPGEETDMQKVLHAHLEHPLRSQAFFNYMLGVA